VALLAGDMKVSWSMEGYLEDLRREFEETLSRAAQPGESEGGQAQEPEAAEALA
jgi:hypothetical protein